MKKIIFMSFFFLSSELLMAQGIDCRLINCDCMSIDAGIITEPWREQCFEVEGTITKKCEDGETKNIYCDSVAHGKLAWPLEGEETDPPVLKRLDQFAEGFDKATSEEDKIDYYQGIRNEMDGMQSYLPELALVNSAAKGVLDSLKGLREIVNVLNGAKYTPPKEKELFGDLGRELVDANADLDKGMFERPPELYDLVKWLERMAAYGIGIGRLVGEDPSRLATYEKGIKWVKTGLSGEALSEQEAENEKKFVNDLLSAIPKESSPALAGPVGKFFRDLMTWNQGLWNETNNAMNLISDTIETGEFDEEKYEQITNRLNDLEEQGPWSMGRATDFVKKMVEELPGVGKLVKAIWS